MNENTRSFWLHLALLLACCAIATYPLIHAGLFQGHDFQIEVVRVAEYAHMLQAGIFPVRWGADLEGGYGYPIYNFFPPLFMLIASVFVNAASLSVLSAIKLTLFLLTFAAGIGMYWFAREHYEKNGAVLAACLYILVPYHFIDIFIRNAFSEFTAMAVVPFVFYGLARLLKEAHPGSVATLALVVSSTLFLLSHNLSVFMYAPLLLGYVVLYAASTQQWGKLLYLIVPIFVAFTLSSFYTLPLLFEKQFVQLWMLTTGKFNVLNNFLPVSDLTPFWLTPLGWIVMAVSSGMLIRYRCSISKPTFAILCFFIVTLLTLLFLSTPASRVIWSKMELLKWLQFPWRLLSPATFIICFMAGVFAYPSDKNVRTILIVGFILTGVVTLATVSTAIRGNYVSIANEALTPKQIQLQWLPTTILSEYLPIWVREKPSAPVEDRLTSSRPDTDFLKIEESPRRHFYKVVATGETWLTANLFYFPGWKLYVNGEEVKPNVTEQGLMQFHLPKGQFQLDLKFENTPVRTLGNSLSILGLLLLGIMIFLAISPTRRQQFQENQDGGK